MEDLDHILVKVLSGNADSDDCLAFNDWLSQSKENREEFQRLKSYWNANIHYDESLQTLPSMESVRAKIKFHDNSNKNRSIIWTIAAAAACIALLIASAFYFMSPREQTVATHYYTYVSGNARINIPLSDGTKITLNKNSRLTVSDAFNKDTRSVKLNGEAFFSVAKNAKCPFIVSANKSEIKVLGTKFNVNAQTSEKVVVTLIEGSVCFMTGNKRTIMKPKDQLICSASNISVKTVDVDSISAWKDGLLKYKSIELTELIQKIETRFGVTIKMENQTNVDTLRVTASFRENQGPEEILNIITGSLPLKWSKRGGVYIISDKKADISI